MNRRFSLFYLLFVLFCNTVFVIDAFVSQNPCEVSSDGGCKENKTRNAPRVAFTGKLQDDEGGVKLQDSIPEDKIADKALPNAKDILNTVKTKLNDLLNESEGVKKEVEEVVFYNREETESLKEEAEDISKDLSKATSYFDGLRSAAQTASEKTKLAKEKSDEAAQKLSNALKSITDELGKIEKAEKSKDGKDETQKQATEEATKTAERLTKEAEGIENLLKSSKTAINEYTEASKKVELASYQMTLIQTEDRMKKEYAKATSDQNSALKVKQSIDSLVQEIDEMLTVSPDDGKEEVKNCLTAAQEYQTLVKEEIDDMDASIKKIKNVTSALQVIVTPVLALKELTENARESVYQGETCATSAEEEAENVKYALDSAKRYEEKTKMLKFEAKSIVAFYKANDSVVEARKLAQQASENKNKANNALITITQLHGNASKELKEKLQSKLQSATALVQAVTKASEEASASFMWAEKHKQKTADALESVFNPPSASDAETKTATVEDLARQVHEEAAKTKQAHSKASVNHHTTEKLMHECITIAALTKATKLYEAAARDQTEATNTKKLLDNNVMETEQILTTISKQAGAAVSGQLEKMKAAQKSAANKISESNGALNEAKQTMTTVEASLSVIQVNAQMTEYETLSRNAESAAAKAEQAAGKASSALQSVRTELNNSEVVKNRASAMAASERSAIGKEEDKKHTVKIPETYKEFTQTVKGIKSAHRDVTSSAPSEFEQLLKAPNSAMDIIKQKKTNISQETRNGEKYEAKTNSTLKETNKTSTKADGSDTFADHNVETQNKALEDAKTKEKTVDTPKDETDNVSGKTTEEENINSTEDKSDSSSVLGPRLLFMPSLFAVLTVFALQ